MTLVYFWLMHRVFTDALDGTMNPADEKEDVDALIKQVNSLMNTFTDEQKDYAKKAIAEKDAKKLKMIIAKINK